MNWIFIIGKPPETIRRVFLFKTVSQKNKNKKLADLNTRNGIPAVVRRVFTELQRRENVASGCELCRFVIKEWALNFDFGQGSGFCCSASE